MNKTDAIEVYTVSLLKYGDEYLLLQRSEHKSFAPNRWTGIGGHVENNEFDQLRSSALREIYEESGIQLTDIFCFVLRRILFVCRPEQPLKVLLYFTGELSRFHTPACSEGILSWKKESEFDNLDIIETTKPVLYHLIKDMNFDPEGIQLPQSGLAVFNPVGNFINIIWSQNDDALNIIKQ